MYAVTLAINSCGAIESRKRGRRTCRRGPDCRLSTTVAVTLRAPQCARLASRGLASHRGGPLACTGDLDVPALSRGGLHGVHHLEDMVGHLATGPVRLQDAAAQCGGHVGQTESAAVLCV